jgi:oligopeptide/dipeptide ABC transporter ATP-binding protein
MTVAPLEPVQPNTGRDNAIASVVDLRIHFKSKAGTVHAVDGVNFDIRDGETLGLVGETGCGKSVTARSFLRLVPMPPGVHVGGQVIFRPRDGEPVDLMKASESTLRDIRGNRIAMIFQDPGKALNPGLTIRDQVGEVFYEHRTDEILSDAGIDGSGTGAAILQRNASMKSRSAERVLLALPPLRSRRNRIRAAVNERVAEALAETQIPNPIKVMDRYPHELSGGMRQRVMIAAAIAADPELLIADEPTTALDVTVQAEILRLLISLSEERQMSVLFVSHDLGVIRYVCDRVAVIYGGLVDDIESKHRVDKLADERFRRFRRNCQMVFQDSFASLNPRHLVKDIVGRPLHVHKEASGTQLTERVVELLELVGLGRQHLYRYPHQFSGGQRQRISIARALALDPELIVLDEPTSALDVSVQAQILNLLHELQQERNLTYLFITHDLGVVRHMADRIVVMYLGRVAEAGPTDRLFAEPHHPYTQALLGASPDVEDDDGSGFRGLEGSVPDPAHPPQGCRFHTRCPLATPVCGWEVDDVVRWLEDEPGLFDTVSGVERHSPFDAGIGFEGEDAAKALIAALGSEKVPAAMRSALESAEISGSTVRVRFRPVDEVVLTDRGPNHVAACVLDELPALP